MSGPKLIEVRRMEAARERQRNRDRCATCGSEYTRLLQELRDWGKRLIQLGLPVADEVQPPEALRARIDGLLRQEFHHEAARIYGEEVARLRKLVEKRHNQFQEHLLAFGHRHRQWLRDCDAIAAGRTQLRERLQTAIPTSWPEDEQRRLRDSFRPALAEAVGPAPAGFPDSLEAIKTFEAAECAARTALAALRAAPEQLERELNATHARLLASRLAAQAPASPSLAEVLRPFKSAPEPAPREDHTAAEIARLLGELAAFSEDTFLQNARQKAESVRMERDSARRGVLAEALLIDCSVRLKERRQLARWREDVQQLIDSAAHLDDAAVDGIVAELRLLLAAERMADLEPVRLRLRAEIEAAEARREREFRRRALMESVRSLGYEASEGLETALVKGGRLVLRRPGEDEYAVELVADAELNQLQTALVRYSDTAEMTEQQKRRDREREERWCEDHGRLREQLAARGFESQFKMRLRPGEHPVKVIVDQSRSAAARAQAAQSDLRKTKPAP